MITALFVFSTILLLTFPTLVKQKIKKNFLLWVFIGFYTLLFFIAPMIKYGSLDFSQITFVSSTFSSITDKNLIKQVLLFQITFYLLVVTGYICTKSRNKPVESAMLKADGINKIIVVCSLISIVASCGLVFFSGMTVSQLLVAGRFAFWETKSGWPFLFSSYLQMVLTVPAFLIHYRNKQRKLRFLLIVAIAALIFTQLIIFGTRTPVIAVGTAYIMGLLTYRRDANIKSKTKRIALLGVICTHIAITWQYMRYNMRSFDGLQDWILAMFNFKEAYKVSMAQGDLSYFFEAAITAFYSVPNHHDYLYGDTYLRILLFPFPSSLFSFKPEETQRVFASIINPDAYYIGQTLPPSVIGDSYMNFGFFGVIVGLAVGIMLKMWQNSLNQPLTINKVTIGSAGMVFLFLFMRGTFNGMYNFIFIWIVVTFVMKVFVRRPKSTREPALVNVYRPVHKRV